MHNLPELQKMLLSPQRIAIITHHNPDGDAMGSSLGLYHYFLAKNLHQLTVVLPSAAPKFLGFLPDSHIAISYDQQPELCVQALEEATLIFCLDFNDPARVYALQQALEQAQAPKVMIDHHLYPKDFCTFEFSQPSAAATCQLIYDFIVLLNDAESLSPSIAQCLYTGIVTDTGSFRFAATTAQVHQIAAHLIELGAKNTEIHQSLYDINTPEKLKFLGYCLSQKMHVLPQYKTAYLSVSLEELRQHHSQPQDTEGLVNYALSIQGVALAVIMIERTHEVKLSFRSKGAIPANLFAEIFSGGGHKNAAGGQSKKNLAETTERFLEELPAFAQKYIV